MRGARRELHAIKLEMKPAVAMQAAGWLGTNDRALQFSIHREKEFFVRRKYGAGKDGFDRRANAIGGRVERSYVARERFCIFWRGLTHGTHFRSGNLDRAEIEGI